MVQFMSLASQFGHPRGIFGALVGYAMALKNGKRSRAVLDVLAPHPGERILEVGFGPGVDIRRVLDQVGPDGSVAGVDVSEVMLRQASRRNRRALADHRATLRLASVEALPFAEGTFDAAFSINCIHHTRDIVAALRELRRVMKLGGRAVTAAQPMRRGATRVDSEQWGERIARGGAEAGWLVHSVALVATSPPTATVTLINPQG